MVIVFHMMRKDLAYFRVGEWGPLSGCGEGALTAGASLVVGHELSSAGSVLVVLELSCS